jgi:hypothetical protein
VSFRDDLQLVPGVDRKRETVFVWRHCAIALAVQGADSATLYWPDGIVICTLTSPVTRDRMIDAVERAMGAPDWRPDYTIPEDYYAR